MNKKRKRRIGSIKRELLCKSREAALAAVQIFNNPNITFKSESFIVLMVIAWTYLLHAYYRSEDIEYRYCSQKRKRRRFHRTKSGAYKYWELERCLNDNNSPIDRDTANNLRFLIGLRHEIEHQMTTRIDDLLSARFQACCLNYNYYLEDLFSVDGIDKQLSFSLQSSAISVDQREMLTDYSELPASIQSYVQGFESALSEEEYNSPRFAYRVLFLQKTANHKGQADRVIEFLKSDSPLAEKLNTEYAVIKETEKPKYLPRQIVKVMHSEGFPNFTVYNHTQLWKQLDGKTPGKGYGTMVAGKHWHWYERWVDVVREHCIRNRDKFS